MSIVGYSGEERKIRTRLCYLRKQYNYYSTRADSIKAHIEENESLLSLKVKN